MIIFLICLLFFTDISYGSVSVPIKMNETVEFRFTGKNTFYSKACKNKGKVLDFIVNEEDDLEYMVKIKCRSDAKKIGNRLIWIHSRDVVKVLSTGP